jgi:cbb3-type cytochrome oxidase maturation protein
VDALYLLIPLSVVLILAIGALLVWAVMSGQFESLDREGHRILDDEDAPAQVAPPCPGVCEFDLNQAHAGVPAYDPQRPIPLRDASALGSAARPGTGGKTRVALIRVGV